MINKIDYTPCSEVQSLLPSFNLATIDKVTKLFSNAHLTTCPLDSVPSQMIRSPSATILHSLTRIFNLSFSSGTFLESLTHVLVTPILKKPSPVPTNLNHLHPISLIPFSSKLLERLFHKWLNDHLTENSLISFSADFDLNNPWKLMEPILSTPPGPLFCL